MFDNKDGERFFNLMIYRIWATDDELDEMLPIIGSGTVIAGIIFGIWFIFHYFHVI